MLNQTAQKSHLVEVDVIFRRSLETLGQNESNQFPVTFISSSGAQNQEDTSPEVTPRGERAEDGQREGS